MESLNEKKANEIANAFFIENVSAENEQVIREMLNKAALGAMEWKDEQHEQEKQQVLEKAIKLMQQWILEHDYVDIFELEDYIKQQMEDDK